MTVLYLPLKALESTADGRTAIFMPVCNHVQLITVANVTKFRYTNKQNSVKVYLIR